MNDISHIFALFFLMLGPFKIIGPYAKMTMAADRKLARNIAVRAILFSSTALLLAALIGENILKKYGIPIPILAMTGGIILFLVALMKIIQQFTTSEIKEEETPVPTLKMAISPLAFPIIVTPYGIASVIVFLALAPDQKTKLILVAIVIGIQLVNLIVMLLTRYIFKYLSLALLLLGSILGIVQVALGLQIIYKALMALLNS